jgi:hypothetical protein
MRDIERRFVERVLGPVILPPRVARSVTEAKRESRRLAVRKSLRKLAVWLSDYKVAHGCVDCGYSGHPHALQFDHVRGVKRISVSHCKSIESARKEIAKCEVRCANCHAIMTHNRQMQRRFTLSAAKEKK